MFVVDKDHVAAVVSPFLYDPFHVCAADGGGDCVAGCVDGYGVDGADGAIADSRYAHRYIVTPPPAAHPNWRGTST